MLSVKQGNSKYHFLSPQYDLTWHWTPISRIIGEHSTPANGLEGKGFGLIIPIW